MYWLAINRDWVSLAELQSDIFPSVTKARLLETLEYLGRRSLLEKSNQGFTQQPVVMEYMTEKLLEQVFTELVILAQPITIFHRYALIKATAREYVRESQVRLILTPLIERLQAYFQSQLHLEDHLQQVLQQVRSTFANSPTYSVGNLLNLFCHLKTNLQGYDFSYLHVWQAYLVSSELHQVNFKNADLSYSVFAETIGVGRTLTFSPDSELLATSDVFTIRVWHVATGQQLLTLHHANWIWRIAFSPDSKVLATASIDRVVKLWDLTTGECLYVLEGDVDGCRAVTFSPDGRWLLGCGDDAVKIWDIATRQQHMTLTGHTEKLIDIACSKQRTASGGYLLASSSYDRTIKLWDSTTGSCLHTLEGHTDAVFHISFTPDDRWLVSASADHTIRLWNVVTGMLIR
ncbi:MAG TPA: WD40 repeat domain-containing protein, partial [Allocoleopsis sp.]